MARFVRSQRVSLFIGSNSGVGPPTRTFEDFWRPQRCKKKINRTNIKNLDPPDMLPNCKASGCMNLDCGVGGS